MTPHIATIRIKMPQNGTRERLLSSRNLSTKDLSASAPVVNEVVLELDFIHSGCIAKRLGQVLHKLPRDFYRISVRGRPAKSRMCPQLLSHQRQGIGEGRAGFTVPRCPLEGKHGYERGEQTQQHRCGPAYRQIRPLPLCLDPERCRGASWKVVSICQRKTNQQTICSGSAPRSVHSKAWVLNSPCGSRTTTQRMATTGNPLCCTRAQFPKPPRRYAPHHRTSPPRWHLPKLCSDPRRRPKDSASVHPSGAVGPSAQFCVAGQDRRARRPSVSE